MKKHEQHDNPFEPTYIDGSDYDPMKDNDRIESEYMYNQLSDKEKIQFDKDLKEFNDDLGMFNDDK